MRDDGRPNSARDYLVPPAEGRGPGVLVLHSGRGLTSFVREVCGRLAHRGFVAMATDRFEGVTPRSASEARAMSAELDGHAVDRQLEDAAVFLQTYEAVSRRRIGVLGLGTGGTWAVRLAQNVPTTVRSVVVFYTVPDGTWADVGQPLQAHFAERDREVPPSAVRDLERELQRAGADADIHRYASVEPSFFEAEPTARYDPDAARTAWNRTVEFFTRTLSQ